MTGRHHERQLLDRLVDAVRAGEGQALVVQGVPGVGKTVLLDYLAGHASSSGCRLVKVAGMQSEMELAFAGLHQLCTTILSRIDQLPAPQRDALRTAFGVAAGPPPDRLMVGLATLSLLAGMATERPLICVIDDVQWLDQASAQVLGFAARRLAADPVGLVFAVRDPDVHLAGLPELEVGGLRHEDARALLDAALTGPLDARVRDLIVAETRGNPLALLELPRGLTPAEMAGGFGLPGAVALTSRIEGSFKRQLEALPDSARRLLQLAAADPSGDRALVWRAAGRLGIPVRDAVPAVEAGLAEFGVQVRFRHPLLRSAAYLSASIRQRQQIHAALADVTDPQVDPDRRAWHRAHSSAGPDEEVAVELEQSADRAQARGGMSAAAAFLERAVLLTADPARHADRVLVAATACMHAGALDKTLDLLATARPGELDEFQKVQADLLRAHVALASGVDSDASSRLLKAAKGLESFDMELARETYLAAVGATQMAGQHAGWDVLLEISHAVQVLPTPPGGLRPQDLLLDGLTRLAVDGHTAAGPALQRAAAAVADLPVEDVLRWGWMAAGATALLWDFEGMDAIVGRQVELVRSAGALAQLPLHLGQLGITRPWMGDLAGTASVIAEIDSVGAATGSPTPPYTQLRLLALQGDEAEAFMPIADAIKHATEAGQGLAAAWAHWASALRQARHQVPP